MGQLFSPLELRDITLRNRVGVSPMCQYSCGPDGLANDWHFVHLGSFARGGAGLVFTEAAAVLPEGRISPQDLGIWSDEHAARLRRVTDFVHAQGAIAGIQLAHAGRKASTYRPWSGKGAVSRDEGGWDVVAPSPVAFAPDFPQPRALDAQGMRAVIDGFRNAAAHALEAGLRVIEVHAAHGYLLHQFLSPLSNQRTDEYGGSLENRMRLTLEVVRSVRDVWPARYPLFVRISATDWVPGGWDIDSSIELARRLRECDVDVIDTSSGGLDMRQKIELGPGYQVPFAARIRKAADIRTAAVGLITDAQQAERIVSDGAADLVLLAREMLRQPHWPLLAAAQLGEQIVWPSQYERARPH